MGFELDRRTLGNGAAGLDEAAQKRSIIPPWMRREGMPESDNSLKPSADVDEKKIKTPDEILRAQPRADIPKPVDESVREEDGETQSKAIDEASLQAEYVKAYLAVRRWLFEFYLAVIIFALDIRTVFN